MPRLPAAQMNAAIAVLFVPGETYYAALFSGDPGITGMSGEVTGGTYARQPIVFTAAIAGVESNTAQIVFTGLPALTYGAPFVAIFDSPTGGTYKGGGTNPAGAGSLASGTTLTIPAGGWQVMEI